jgi:hypothetical protein
MSILYEGKTPVDYAIDNMEEEINYLEYAWRKYVILGCVDSKSKSAKDNRKKLSFLKESIEYLRKIETKK